jgi:hypothetical protein
MSRLEMAGLRSLFVMGCTVYEGLWGVMEDKRIETAWAVYESINKTQFFCILGKANVQRLLRVILLSVWCLSLCTPAK